MLRLASLPWRLRRATTMETGLFAIQADQLNEYKQARQSGSASEEIVYALLGQAERVGHEHGIASRNDALPASAPRTGRPVVNPATEFARCFLRLTNLPNFALDRLSRYEATLWRQAGQILFALDALDRRKPRERRRRFHVGGGHELPPFECDE